MRTLRQLGRIFGEDTAARVSTARLLVVGAGGIGCELLKNLSMSGFRHIEVIDLDTIDLSNLNRQFLFQHKHIKRPKAEVAVQAIKAFNPALSAVARQSNIKEPEFDVDWFRGFDLVMNALDNLDARRHVNAMCLAANVPLVESGTAGYLGQVTVIKGGQTECFDCQPKPVEQKTYPVCTIRSTPSAPIHCIVWAKNYLFAQLFGEKSSDHEGMEEDESSENMEELRQLREESRALARLAEAMGSPDFAQKVFQKVFCDDIERLLSMKEMWKHRRPPAKLDLQQIEAAVRPEFSPATCDDQAVLSLEDSFALFRYSADRLAQRLLTQQKANGERSVGQTSIPFDKDDRDTLDFVAATANLRSYAFGIEPKSIFAIKAMAGNIIPAIATTNAIVAGMMVIQAILVLSKRLSECHTTYLSYNSKRSRCFLKEPLSKPNPQCPVCRRRYLTLRLEDPASTTLGDIVKHVCGLAGTEQDLALGDDISVVEGDRILYDPDFEDNLDKPLEELGLVPGKMIALASEDDEAAVPVILSIAKSQKQDGEAIAIEGFENVPVFAPLPAPDAKSGGEEENDAADQQPISNGNLAAGIEADDGVIILDEEDGKEIEGTAELAKRGLENAGVPAAKRQAIDTSSADDDLVVLD
ncbi:hypothetical protein GQ54DRAFT_299063 [Martensiomyces pterosporus]|nr:hypothetical protein GQ54DRAFT_299063 [Martensiomyces pterosporus]